jgi:hypothetical protein
MCNSGAGLEASEPIRTCKVCSVARPRTVDYWYRDKNSPDGLEYTCKVCRLEAKNAKNASNRASGIRQPVSAARMRERLARGSLRKSSAKPRRSIEDKAATDALCRLITAASLPSTSINYAQATAKHLAMNLADLVALVIDHGDQGLTLSSIILLPEAFEIAIRYSEDAKVLLPATYGCTWGPELIRYALPTPSTAAHTMATTYGNTPAVATPGDIDQALATYAHSRCTTIKSLSEWLGVRCPVKTQHGWYDPVARAERLEEINAMIRGRFPEQYYACHQAPQSMPTPSPEPTGEGVLDLQLLMESLAA